MAEDPGAADYLARHWQTGSTGLQDKVDELLTLAHGGSENLELYRDMLLSIVRMAQADRNRWDAKIMRHTIRELETAFARLEQFKRRRKVTVFGSARTLLDSNMFALARELGELLAEDDYMAITGGGGGIMEAVHVGAGLDNSLSFNITLPFEQKPNRIVSGTQHDLPFRFFFLRKLFLVREADALILCPGGFGTLDETLEVLTLVQTGKSPMVPIILLDEPGGQYWKDLLDFFRRNLLPDGYILESDLNLLQLADSPHQALKLIRQFYRNFHSARWLQDQYLMRLNQPLTARALERIKVEFADICTGGGFTQQTPSGAGDEDAELRHLTSLSFALNARAQGRLRALIDELNDPQNIG
ncbi:LOG family protein [Halopseudomonas pertucinogena]|uniref:AMP nucleosidase n=1 Tax=Halopseudomonas pertucinogena TaxID=86175 RepID=A0ABQ2CKC4_9GAMM|nr:TIGR00730 family Rossman fold protein [Halopseudomonas pertucinogena]GGI91443.1 hypothetical protein GCM10009083_04830 [Halopseudomonas pertucinogena]